jgi:hypothetical protein
MDTIMREKAMLKREKLEAKHNALRDTTNVLKQGAAKQAFIETGPLNPPDNSGITMSNADTAILAYSTLPLHAQKTTVNLQSLPGDDSNRRTSVQGYNATNGSMNKTIPHNRPTALTATLRKSTAFVDPPKTGVNNGINALTDSNAITAGLGAVRSDNVSINDNKMKTTVTSDHGSLHDTPHSKQWNGTNQVLGMGRFGPKMKGQGRQVNSRGAITNASRAALLSRPNTVGSYSPARGGSVRGAVNIAMQRLDVTLRDVPTYHDTRNASRVKIDKSLENSVYMKKAKDGMINSDYSKEYYTIKKDKPTWTKIKPSSETKNIQDVVQEIQGVVSWSSDDIRVKWRDEHSRENSWKASRASQLAAEELLRNELGGGTGGGSSNNGNTVISSVSLIRHPMHEHYWNLLKKENTIASKRSSMRSKNRRFALDVHTVWLTNLSTLGEHKEPLIQRGIVGEYPVARDRNRGLDDARDVDNIVNARSQIQSVSEKRSRKSVKNFSKSEDDNGLRKSFDNVDFELNNKVSPSMDERPVKLPHMTTLIANETLLIPGCTKPVLLSISRLTTHKRVYYETAAVLINGRWEIPASGGSEKLVPGVSVNRSDDIVKLSPKKYKAKESGEQFFSDSPPNSPVKRKGETLETMEALDSWCSINGKSYQDVTDAVKWRISIFDKENGELKNVVLDEQLLLMYLKEVRRKNNLKYDTTRTNAPAKSNIVHKQGKRINCLTKYYSALMTVSVVEGDGKDNNLYIDINATVHVKRKKKKIQDNNDDGNKQIFMFKKRINTIECRERLSMTTFAPSKDIQWWSHPNRSIDVWRPLLDTMILLPDAPTDEEEIKKDSPSKIKKKTRSKSSEVIPNELTFPSSETDSIFETIGIAFDLIPLITIKPNPNATPAPVVPKTKFPTILPTAWGHLSCIRVEGISDAVHKDDEGGIPWGGDKDVDWECAAEADPDSQSVMLTGHDKYKELCPGVTGAGILEPFDFSGMGYNNFPTGFTGDRSGKERTQAALVLSRDPNTSSTMSIQARLILMLERPAYAPLNLYWELSETPMPPAQHEIIDMIVPQNMNVPTAITENGLDSALNTRIAPVCYILSGSEVPLDFGGLSELLSDEKYDKEEVVVGYNDLGFEIKEVKLTLKARNRNRRRMTSIDPHGFRQNLMVTREILRPVSVISPAVFGITAKGASSNHTAVGGRTIWHSEQRCIEALCRQRTPFDYIDVIRAKSGSGYCDPRGYTMLLKGYSLDDMVGVGSIVFHKVYERINKKHDRANKMQGLSAKIAQAEENLRRNRTQLEREIRMTSQKAVATKAKFGDTEGKLPDAMTREAWLVRYEVSTLIEVRNGWEKRQMPDGGAGGGAVFYYKNMTGVEGGEIECSWDIPFDFEHWEPSEVKPGDMVGDAEEGEDGLGDGDTSEDVARKREQAKVEMLAKMIASDETLLQTLANKLGILVKKDKGDGLDLNMRKTRSRDQGVLETALADEDNDWSDEDFEHGDEGDLHGETSGRDLAGKKPLPQHHGDVADHEREQYREGIQKEHDVPKNVPKLALNPDKSGVLGDDNGDDESGMHIEKHVKGKGWRRLARAKVAPNFMDKITKPKSLSKDKYEGIANTSNKVRLPVMVDPCKAIQVEDPPFPHRMESLFIKDVMGDQLRNIEGTRKRQEREELLMKAGGMEDIVANQPNEMTLADMMEGGAGAAPGEDDDPEHLAAKALECARTGNIQELEFILDRNIIDVDAKDGFGNSLLHLACQQGNKRMAKFLLRRGSSITTQNAAGNSVLHHCHAYSHMELAQYLLSKGADDSLINSEGCTCYEGLRADEVDEI